MSIPSSKFLHEFPDWDDSLPDDKFEDVRLNQQLENSWVWQDASGYWVFDTRKNRLGGERMILGDEKLLYCLKYIFVKKLQIAKRYPRTYKEFEDLRKKSFFFSKPDLKCYPTPIIGPRIPRTTLETQRVSFLAGANEDFVQFDGDYSKVVYFEDILLQENAIGDVGMLHLTDFLVCSNVLVRNFRIYKNNVGELGARAIASYLLKAPIGEFHASHNYIPKLGAIALVVAASSNPNLPVVFPEYDKWYKWKRRGNVGRTASGGPPPMLDQAKQTFRGHESGNASAPCWMRLEYNIIEDWHETHGAQPQNAFMKLVMVGPGGPPFIFARQPHRWDPRAVKYPSFMNALRTARSETDLVICEITAKSRNCAPRFCKHTARIDARPPLCVPVNSAGDEINLNYYKKVKLHLCFMNSSDAEVRVRKSRTPPEARVGYEGQLFRYGYQLFMRELLQAHRLPAKSPAQGGLLLTDSVRKLYPTLDQEGAMRGGGHEVNQSAAAVAARATEEAAAAHAAAVASSVSPPTVKLGTSFGAVLSDGRAALGGAATPPRGPGGAPAGAAGSTASSGGGQSTSSTPLQPTALSMEVPKTPVNLQSVLEANGTNPSGERAQLQYKQSLAGAAAASSSSAPKAAKKRKTEKAALKATLEKSAHQIEEQKAAARAEKKVLKEWGRVQEESKRLKKQAAILQRFHPRTMLGDADTADNPELKSLRKNREAAVEEFCETLDPASAEDFRHLRRDFCIGTVAERYYTAEELRENSRKLREMFVEKLRGVCQMDHDLKSLLLNESCPVDNFWGNVRRVCEDKYGVNHRFAQGFFPWQALSSVVWECNERLGMCVEPFSGRDISEEEVLLRAEDTRYGWVVIMPRYCTPAPPGTHAAEEAGGGNGNGNGSVPAPASSKSKGSPRPISWVKQVNLVRILRWIMIEQGELWKLDAATALNPVARYFDDFHLAVLKRQDRPMMKRLNGVNNVGQGLLLTERVSNAWVHRLTQMREYESLQLKAFKLRLYEALLEYFLKVEVPHVRQLLLGCRKQVPDNKRRFGLLLKKSAELRRKEETAAASKAAARAKSAGASASSSVVSSKAKGKHTTVEQRLGRTATVKTEVHGGVSVTPAMQQRFAALFGGDVYLQVALSNTELRRNTIISDGRRLLSPSDGCFGRQMQRYNNEAAGCCRNLRLLLDRIGEKAADLHQCEGNRLHIPLPVQEELAAQVRKLADGENSLMYQLATAKADEQQRAREEGVPDEKQEEAFTADLKLKKKRDKLDELEGLAATTVDADAKRQRLERSKRYYTRELKKIESAFPQWSAARERVKNLTEEVKRAERAILVSLDDSLQENLEVPHLWDEEVDEYQGCVFDQAWRLLDEVMHLETQKKGCERALVESLGRGDVHESWRDNALLLRPEAYWCGTERGHLMETLPFLYVPEIMDADCMQQLLSRAPEVFSNRRCGPVPHYTPPLTKPQFPKPVPGDGLRGSSHPFGTKIAPKVRILAAPAPYTEESAAGFVTEIDKGVRDLAMASVTAVKEAKRKKAAAEQQGQNIKSSALNDPRSYFLKTKVSERGGPRLPVGGGESHAADGTTRDGSLQGRAASMCRPDGSPRVPDIPLEALLENRDADSCPLRWSAGVRQEEEADTLESVLRDAQLPAPKEEVRLWLPTPDQEARVAQAVEAEAVARELAAERKKAAQMKKADRAEAAGKAKRAKQAKTDQNLQVLGGQQQTHSQLQKEGSRTEKKPQDHDGASSKGGEEPSLLDYLVQRSDLDQSALAQNASASASSRNLSMHFYADGTTTAGEAPSTSTPSHQGGAARGPAAVHAKEDNSTTGSGGTAGTSLSLKEKDSSMKINEKPRDVVPPWLRNKQPECDQVEDWRQPAPSKFPSSGAGAYVPPRHGQSTSSSAAQEAGGAGELISSRAVPFGGGSREEKHEAVDQHREMGAATATSSSMTQQGLSVSSAGKYRYNYNSASTTSTNAANASGAAGYPAAGSTSGADLDARTSFEYYRYGMAPQDASWRAAQLDALIGVNATGSTGSGTPAAGTGSWHDNTAPQHATTSAHQAQQSPAFYWFYDAYGTQQIIPANNLPNDARVADTPSMCRETGSSGANGLYRMTQQEIATIRQYDSFYEHSASGSRSAPQQSGTSRAGGSTSGSQFAYGAAVVHGSCASPVSPGGWRRVGSGVAVSSSGANGSAKGSSSAAAYATGAHHQAYGDGNQFGGYGAYGASGQYAQHYKNQQAQYHQYAAAGPQSTTQQQNPYTSSAQARTGTGTAGETPPTGSSPIEEAALMAQQQALVSQQRALQMATTGYRPPAQSPSSGPFGSCSSAQQGMIPTQHARAAEPTSSLYYGSGAAMSSSHQGTSRNTATGHAHANAEGVEGSKTKRSTSDSSSGAAGGVESPQHIPFTSDVAPEEARESAEAKQRKVAGAANTRMFSAFASVTGAAGPTMDRPKVLSRASNGKEDPASNSTELQDSPAPAQRLNESLESDYMSDPEADSPELPARGSAQPNMSGSMRLQPPTTSSKDAAQYVPKTVDKMARKIGQTKSFLGISKTNSGGELVDGDHDTPTRVHEQRTTSGGGFANISGASTSSASSSKNIVAPSATARLAAASRYSGPAAGGSVSTTTSTRETRGAATAAVVPNQKSWAAMAKGEKPRTAWDDDDDPGATEHHAPSSRKTSAHLLQPNVGSSRNSLSSSSPTGSPKNAARSSTAAGASEDQAGTTTTTSGKLCASHLQPSSRNMPRTFLQQRARAAQAAEQLPSHQESDILCEICYENDNEVKFFDCWHEMCRRCHKQYFDDQKNSTCPVCRQTVLVFIPTAGE